MSDFKMDLSTGIKVVANMSRKLADNTELLNAIGELLVSSTKDRMNDGKQPDGEPQSASARGGTPLKDKGLLAKSITYEHNGAVLQVGSNLEYARIHQLGGKIKAKKAKYLKFKNSKGNWVMVKEVNIPARPFVGISKDDKDEIQLTITDYYINAFKR